MTAQTKYSFNNYQDGFSLGSRNSTTTTVIHNLSSITIENVDRAEVQGQTVTMSGIHIANEAGAPDLPSSSTFIAIPNGSHPTVRLVSSASTVIPGIDLIPAREPQLDNDDTPAVFHKDMSIYGRDAYYPATPYSISEVITLRGVQVVQVGVMPFQYNPVTKELVVYSDVELEVSWEGGDGNYGDLRYRTPEWDQILSDVILNREALPEVDYGERLRKHYEQRETGCEYLIITPDNDDFIQLADSIREFRTAQGIPTDVFTVTQCGGNTGTAIKNFIRNAYNNWDMPPAAVLILGDHSTDPTQGVVSFTMNNHPGGSGYNPYISDHAYAVMNNQHMPDIIMGRITGRDYEEMYRIIKKDLDYERTPPTNPDFYDKPVTAMGFQLERWFQLCSEVVNGFWEHGLGKHPVRVNAIYQGTPGSNWSTYEHTNEVLHYFGPNGCDYIPSTMSHLTDWNGTGNDINDCINNGAFIVQHRDHGSEELWGEPRYNIGYIKRLSNNDLTYVMSNNCLTGRFDYDGLNGCFAEAFHRHQQGALGLIAATQVSYSFVNDVYVWGAYDNLWPDFMPTYGTEHPSNFLLPAFGNAAGKYFLRQSSWTDSGVKQITYYLFHQHGDAYMNLYSEMPQNLSVDMLPVLRAGSDQYELKVDEGATICLTANGQIIGFDYGTGETQYVTVIPQEVNTKVRLTIKKQNYYRYEHLLNTIPSEGPYLIFQSASINDSEGNANQEADYNETFRMGIGLRNVGTSDINHVTAVLHCPHPSVEILQDEADFGTITVDGIITVDDAFTIHIGDGVSDGESIRFYIESSDNSTSFIDSVSLVVNAPSLHYGNVTLTDIDGSPVDRLMPGESSLVTFDITNTGHSRSLGQTHTLTVKAPFVNVTENQLELSPIEVGSTSQVTFQVDTDEEVTEGNILDYTITAESGYHTTVAERSLLLGYAYEGFEGEVLNTSFTWDVGSGNKAWYVIEDESAVGGHCMRSPAIGNTKRAYLFIELTREMSSSFSFMHRTSTDEGDKLLLHINNEEQGAWSGETEWETSSFELAEGRNLIKFTFQKDGSGSAGDDCVMIDELKLPPVERLIVFAGNDTESCPNLPFVPDSYASHYSGILWTSDGDGYFDDASIERPIYNFGENDRQNGLVTLTMTANDDKAEQQSGHITINLLNDLGDTELDAPEGDTLVDLRLATQSVYQAQFDGEATVEWSLEPEDAGSITAEGSQAIVEWAEGYTGWCAVTYSVSNSCGTSEASSATDIRVMNSTSVGEHNQATVEVYPNPAKDQVRIKAIGLGEGEVTVRFIDILGRVVVEMKKTSSGATFSTSIDTFSLPSGLYDIQLNGSGKTHNSRVLIF